MREIPLLKTDGTIDECSVGIIQACMMFPDDAASIEDEIGAWRQRSATGFRNTELGRYQQNSWRSAQFGGMCAGDMLHTMCMFKTHRPEMLVGMNKAAMMTTIGLEKHGRKFSKNESTIKKYWSEYKNAAHLWAALMLEFRDNVEKFPINFMRILNIAEGLIDCGNAVVEGWEPWRAPSPVLTATAVEIRKPDAEDIALAEKYRASGQHLALGLG